MSPNLQLQTFEIDMDQAKYYAGMSQQRGRAQSSQEQSEKHLEEELQSPTGYELLRGSQRGEGTVVRNEQETVVRQHQRSDFGSEAGAAEDGEQEGSAYEIPSNRLANRRQAPPRGYENEYGESGPQHRTHLKFQRSSGENVTADDYNLQFPNVSSYQRSQASFQEQYHHQDMNQEERRLTALGSSSNGKATHISSNIFRGASESRPTVQRIVPYQRDSNSSGSRHVVETGPLFAAKDIETDSNRYMNLQQKYFVGQGGHQQIDMDDQFNPIALMSGLDNQTSHSASQGHLGSGTLDNRRSANQIEIRDPAQLNSSSSKQSSVEKITWAMPVTQEQFPQNLGSQSSRRNRQGQPRQEAAPQFSAENQQTFQHEAAATSDSSERRDMMIQNQNQELALFYDKMEEQHQQSNPGSASRATLEQTNTHHPSTGWPLVTQTTGDGPNSNPSFARPANVGQNSDSRQALNQQQLPTGQSAQCSRGNLYINRSHSSGGLNYAAVMAQQAVTAQYMQAIPFDNEQREDDQEEAYYDEEQNLDEEQQDELSQREDNPNHNGASEGRHGYQGLSQQPQQNQMRAQQQFVINQSAELEGLDLTEDDLEGHETESNIQHSQIKQPMTVNKLSTIYENQDYTAKDSYHLSEEHQLSQIRALGNFQGNFENLEQVEAELQAEVEQLDLIYAQHKNMNYQQMQRRAGAHHGEGEQFLENLDDLSQIQGSHEQHKVGQQETGEYEIANAEIDEEDYDEGNIFLLPQAEPGQGTQHYQPRGQAAPYLQSDYSRKLNYTHGSRQREVSTRSQRELSLSIGGFQQQLESETHHQAHGRLRQQEEMTDVDDQDGFRQEQEEAENEEEQQQESMEGDDNASGTSLVHILQDQISELSHYKQMCEQRIRQLQPGHPLPIQLEHMNQPNHAVIQQHQNQISQLLRQHQMQTQQLRNEIEQLKRVNRLSSQTSGPQQFDMGNSFGGEAQLSGQKAPAGANVASAENTSQNPHMNSSSVEYSIQLNQQVTQMRSAFGSIKHEKSVLEKSLRRETQINEELNLKLQILKDALEQKIQIEYPQLKAYVTNTQQRVVAHNSDISPLSSEKETMANALSTGNTNRAEGTGKQVQVVDYYLQMVQTQAENEKMKKQVSQLNSALEEEQYLNQVLQQQEGSYLQKPQEASQGRSKHQLESNQRTMQVEIDKKNKDILFYKDQIDKSKARYAQLADDCGQLLTNQQDQEGRTSQLVGMRNELDDKAREISDLKRQRDNLEKKLRDQNHRKESLKFATQEGQDQVSIYKDRVRDETNEIFELQRTIDDLHLEINTKEQEKTRAREEAKMLEKTCKIQVESLNQIIKQNKEYLDVQEQNTRDLTSKYQSEVLQQRKKFEEQNLNYIQQISKLNSKIAGLEQKCYTVEFEKTQVDETLVENSSAKQNYEIGQIKLKQLTDKNRQILTQLTNAQKRIDTFEQKHELNLQQIENLKTQNAWLKDERQKTIEESTRTKKELEVESKKAQDLQHSVNMLEGREQINNQQVVHELDRKSKQVVQQEQKLEDLTKNMKQLKAQKDAVDASNKQLERNLIELQSNLQHALRDKQLLDNQFLDIKEENDQLYRNEERIKGLIADLESQKSKTHVIYKENQYNEQKIQKYQCELDNLEQELRMLKRDKVALDELVSQLKNKQSQSNQQILDHIHEIQRLKSNVDQNEAHSSNYSSQAKMNSYKIEEQNSKIDNLEACNEDLRSQISRHIARNNDNCLKFEQEAKLLEGVKLIQQNAMDALIAPFISGFSSQIETSDILKDCLFASDPENRSLELFKSEIGRFLKMKDNSDVLQTQRSILFEYCKFLHQEILEKLVAGVIESKSENILQSKKNTALSAKLGSSEETNLQQEHFICQLKEDIGSLESQIAEQENEARQNRTQIATYRSKLKNMELDMETLQIIGKEKDKEIVNIAKENIQTNNQTQHSGSINDQIELEQLEKKHLWKALKCLKVFLKSDGCFQGLLVMLNEYIVLLEQLMFDKKQNQKRLGTLTIKSTQTAQKLRMVENDMKCFQLPTNESHPSITKPKPLVRCNSTNYQTEQTKTMKTMRLPHQQSTFSQFENTFQSNKLEQRLNYQTQNWNDSRPPKSFFNPNVTQSSYQNNSQFLQK